MGSYCSTCRGAIASHKFKGDTEFYLGQSAAVGVWYTQKGSISIDANCTNIYNHLYVSAGAEILIDNIKYTDKNGNVAVEFNMDSGTLSGEIFGSNNPMRGAEIIIKNQRLWVSGTLTDFSTLTVPDSYSSYLTLTTDYPSNPSDSTAVTGDNYDIKLIFSNIGIKTYGSNGVLLITPSENKYYNINSANFGADLEVGTQYRLSFDYNVTKLAPGDTILQ